MTIPYPYMGVDCPTVQCRIDPYRWANPNGQITDRRFPSKVALHWVVAVVDCPHCGDQHEHHMAARVGWGYYRAPCTRINDPRDYYLIVTD